MTTRSRFAFDTIFFVELARWPLFIVALYLPAIFCRAASCQHADTDTFNSPPVAVGRQSDPQDVADLKAIQEQVQKVLNQAVAATVAIQIGTVQGSGVVVSSDGDVLTAGHVAEKPGQQALIFLSDGRRAPAITRGVNIQLDIGLLKINDRGPWPHVPMRKQNGNLQPGQWCLATGHPGGYQRGRPPAVRLGRLTGRQKTFVVTDCTLTAGDSGGPLFDLSGQVAAIHSRISGPLESNLHVPVEIFHESWNNLVTGRHWGLPTAARPYIGVVKDPIADRARIQQVLPNTPAASAGLQAGDVITHFDGGKVDNFVELAQKILIRRPGETVTIRVLRDENSIQLRLEIGERGR